MLTSSPKFVIVASTGGAVMNELLKVPFFHELIYSVVSDRSCPAIAKAADHSIQTRVFPEKDKAVFCARLLEYLNGNQIDYVISFFTKLFVGELLTTYSDCIINLHPSLLPAFKGQDGFGDALAYGVNVAGTTIHFIDEKMDEGKIIIQTSFPLDPTASTGRNRHRVFQHQCQSLLQVVKWLTDGRLVVEGKRVVLQNARYVDSEFVPALDFSVAKNLAIPYSGND